ncbi:MAG: efflux RND transporter periplasmic adaptor subunit, partial [Candidatus Xenobia bacterium]
VREGDQVRQGEPLVWLDDKDLQAQVAQAEAAVAAARARVSQLQTGSGMTQTQVNVDVSRARQGVDQAHAATARAQAEYDDASVDLHRKMDLVRQGAIPQVQLDTARLRYRQAVDGLRAQRSLEDSARETLRLAQSNTGQTRVAAEEVEGAQASLQQAQAALQSAEVNLGYAVLYAPISGKVIYRKVDPGQTVSPQQGGSLLRIVDNSNLELLVPVDERFASWITPDEPVDVTAATRPGAKFRARVKEIVPSSDTASHSVNVRISVLNIGESLIDGVYVQAHMKIRDHSGVIVPAPALQTRDDGSFVMLVHGNTVQKEPVTVDFQTGTEAVVAGVHDGDELVTTGSGSVESGQEIQIDTPSPSPSAAR